MPTVDSKGRIVLPIAVREELGIEPGSEVTVRTRDHRVILEPEDDPSDVIQRLEALIEEAAVERERRRGEGERSGRSASLDEDLIAAKQRRVIRSGANRESPSDRENGNE